MSPPEGLGSASPEAKGTPTPSSQAAEVAMEALGEHAAAAEHQPVISTRTSALPETSTSAAGNNTNSRANNSAGGSGGFYLRWSRLSKHVEIKDNTGGLLGRSHISDSTTFRRRPDETNSNNTNSNNSSQARRLSSFKTTTTKTILDSVSGYAAPGEILCVMGPSGSGKTTLMNVISGRSCYQQGVLSCNGQAITSQHAMKRLIMAQVAYVRQADVFFEHLTVRDQLTYTALLRLPEHEGDKQSAVNSIVRQLRLTAVVDSPIHLLSGGEKKRVNIATELLSAPAVLLLDEPTSGLDSTSAVSLLQQQLGVFARQEHKTVICSIHQPSSRVFSTCFDRLLLLSQGKVVYFGTPMGSLDYLKQRLDLTCPAGYNVADYWMDLLVGQGQEQEEKEKEEQWEETNGSTAGEVRQRRGGTTNTNRSNNRNQQQSTTFTTSPPRVRLQEAWDNEAVAEQMDLQLVRNAAHGGHGKTKTANDTASLDGGGATTTTVAVAASSSSNSKYPTSWTTQYWVLTHRALKNSRSAIFTPLNLSRSLALGLVAGALWFQLDYTESNIYAIRSYIFFTMTFWVLDALFNSLLAFPAERDVILKERASGSFRVSAYFLAKTTSDIPVRILLPLLYMTTSWWMIGFSRSVRVFLGAVGNTLLSVVAGEALGLCAGALIYDLEQALTFVTVFILFLMLLGGFYVERIPAFLDWAKYLSPFKYAFDASLLIALDWDVPCDGSGELKSLCGEGSSSHDGAVAAAEEVREFVGIQGTMGFNVGMLMLICFVPRYFAYLALRMKKEDDRV